MKNNYQKKIKELESTIKKLHKDAKSKDLIYQIVDLMGKSKMTEKERTVRATTIPLMDDKKLVELKKLLENEINAYNEIYLNALQKETEEDL